MNYTSPGAGLPAPDPFPMAAKPPLYRKRRKRFNPKNPWYHAYSGDTWRKPRAHAFYRFRIYHQFRMDMCRVTRHGYPTDPGMIVFDSEFRLAAPRFKALAVAEGLRPDRRAAKFRKGLSISFWDWPEGFVKD